jgi:hypothetical protein
VTGLAVWPKRHGSPRWALEGRILSDAHFKALIIQRHDLAVETPTRSARSLKRLSTFLRLDRI